MPYSGQFLAGNLAGITQSQLVPLLARQNASKVLRKSMAAVDVTHHHRFSIHEPIEIGSINCRGLQSVCRHGDRELIPQPDEVAILSPSRSPLKQTATFTVICSDWPILVGQLRIGPLQGPKWKFDKLRGCFGN